MDRMYTKRGTVWALFEHLMQVETDQCVEWPGARHQCGHGVLRKDGKNQMVHRLALQIITGIPGEGLEAIHGSCHNPACMNVLGGHVRWGTHAENMRDRQRDGTGNRGSDHGMAKLTELGVRKIHELRDQGLSQQRIADYVGVSRGQVQRILARKQWGWLEL